MSVRSDARDRWYRAIEHIPRLYCSYVRRRQPGRTVVRADSSVVVEGFPGSANSFAVEYLQQANPAAAIASHLHSPAHLLEALRVGVPAALLVRKPVDAVASILVRHQRYELRRMLARYPAFHQPLLGRLNEMAVISFEDVTATPALLVERINERFGVNLCPLDPTPVAETTVLDAVRDRWAASWGEAQADRLAPVPQGARSQQVDSTRARIQAPEHADLLRAAERIYDTIRAATG